MPSLGPAEVLVILVVALLVLGPTKMPEVGRQVARGVRELRKIQQHLSSELREVASEFDVDRDVAPPRGDPVPTLPPKAETERVDAVSASGSAENVDESAAPTETDVARPEASPSTAPASNREQEAPAGRDHPAQPADSA